jgi:hypothetical protein
MTGSHWSRSVTRDHHRATAASVTSHKFVTANGLPCVASPKAVAIGLAAEERRVLEGRARRRKTAQALALRARIVLACADGPRRPPAQRPNRHRNPTASPHTAGDGRSPHSRT